MRGKYKFRNLLSSQGESKSPGFYLFCERYSSWNYLFFFLILHSFLALSTYWHPILLCWWHWIKRVSKEVNKGEKEILYSVQCTVYSVQCTVYNMNCHTSIVINGTTIRKLRVSVVVDCVETCWKSRWPHGQWTCCRLSSFKGTVSQVFDFKFLRASYMNRLEQFRQIFVFAKLFNYKARNSRVCVFTDPADTQL